MIRITVSNANFGLPRRSMLPPPNHPEIVLTIPPFVASAYVKRKPIATEDISIGINQITLKIVSFLPPKSRNVAIASPNGIWIMIDRIMIITLFLNAIQNFVSLISFAQFASPTIFLSAEIPFHWYPLVINVSIIGYAINTTNKMITGARKSAAV